MIAPFICIFAFVIYRLYKIVDSYDISFKDSSGKKSCVYEPHNIETKIDKTEKEKL